MKIAFIKTVGLSSGGGERYLQTMATILAQDGHEIDYYYTNNAPCAGTTWMHPENDVKRKEYVESFGIKTIPIHTDEIGQYQWKNTDFFDKFSENKYDVLQTLRGGKEEYPWTVLNKTKIVDSIHGITVHNKPNIVKCILLCKWQANLWIQAGGDSSKVEIIPSIVYVPEKTNENFRKELNIPEDAFVYGFHQRNEIGLFSSIPLESFKYINTAYFLIMGGSEAHKNYVEVNNIKIKRK